MATGGLITEITWNHPTLGTGVFFGMSSEDSAFDLGGLRSEDDTAKIDGGGNMVDVMNLMRWKFSTTVSWDGNINNELDKLSLLASSPVQTDFTIAHSNGTVWGGKGKPVGDIEGNGQAATFEITLSGGGVLKKISG